MRVAIIFVDTRNLFKSGVEEMTSTFMTDDALFGYMTIFPLPIFDREKPSE